MKGQIDFSAYLLSQKKAVNTCSDCVCSSCLLRQTGRCPHGECYDSKRATDNPYDKAHPDKPPRTTWSNWKTDQAYWCRGGVFHPEKYCENFIKYKGCRVEECIKANVTIFQDGYISCSLVENMGCEACYKEFEQNMETE